MIVGKGLAHHQTALNQLSVGYAFPLGGDVQRDAGAFRLAESSGHKGLRHYYYIYFA